LTFAVHQKLHELPRIGSFILELLLRNFGLECGAYALEILVLEIGSFTLLRTMVEGTLTVQRISRVAGHDYQVLVGNFEASFVDSFCAHQVGTHECIIIMLFLMPLTVCVGSGKPER
jgi:hypothetical protein